MAPALSVIFFTTLSGAGYGLLAWLGLWLALFNFTATPLPSLTRAELIALCIGVALSAIGLLCSVGHLGQPFRAWRAFSQWRTSWLSREGVISVATLVLAVIVGIALLVSTSSALAMAAVAFLGLLLAAGAVTTILCTAMIYASLKPIPAWCHPLVPSLYLMFGMATGFALLCALISTTLGARVTGMMTFALCLFGAILMTLKFRYWYDIDRAASPFKRSAAIGLPDREATVFERPHTESNYITREMGFQIARRHARHLRFTSAALVMGGPALSFALLWLSVCGPGLALSLAAVLMIGGAFVERWLFFAQARHVVTQYY